MVEQHVAATLQRYRGRAPKHSWTQAYLDAEQERIVSLIEEWLDYEAKRADFTVEAGEEKLAATVGDLKLQVRVDRIDAVAGGRVIIDYKTGMLNGVSWDGPRPDEPQLPLYAGFGQIDHLKGVLLGRVREDKVKFIGRVEDARTGDAGRNQVDQAALQCRYAARLAGRSSATWGNSSSGAKRRSTLSSTPRPASFATCPDSAGLPRAIRADAGDEADESDD